MKVVTKRKVKELYCVSRKVWKRVYFGVKRIALQLGTNSVLSIGYNYNSVLSIGYNRATHRPIHPNPLRKTHFSSPAAAPRLSFRLVLFV